VGLILSADTSAPVATYALEGLNNKVLAAKYRTSLPSESVLRRESAKAKDAAAHRKALGADVPTRQLRKPKRPPRR
jgi:hypothetical protein